MVAPPQRQSSEQHPYPDSSLVPLGAAEGLSRGRETQKHSPNSSSPSCPALLRAGGKCRALFIGRLPKAQPGHSPEQFSPPSRVPWPQGFPWPRAVALQNHSRSYQLWSVF